MSLPKIDLPIFEMVLPSSGKPIKYRPFTVKEEKILLVAQESKEPTQEIMAVKQIVNNCLPEIDVETLPMFDLEYVMLVLRSRSVDEFTVDYGAGGGVAIMKGGKPAGVTISLNLTELEIETAHDYGTAGGNDVTLSEEEQRRQNIISASAG